LQTDAGRIPAGWRGPVLGCSLLLGCALHGLAHAWSPDADTRKPAASAEIHLLAKRLQDAPVALRSDFALAVLSELIPAYRQEASRARSEFRRASTAGDAPRWASAVDALVRDMQRLLDGLLPETPVQVSAQDAETLYVIVDGSPVLLAGPRVNEKARLEQRVLERFCSRNDCHDLMGDRQSERSPAAYPESAALWRFNDPAGPVCASGDGLELQFRDDSNLQEKRTACTALLAELNVLETQLRGMVGSGKTVDWNRLAIQPTAGSELQRIVVNGEGDYVLMSLPTLERAHRLFVQVLPWLAARVGDKRYNLVILNTETKLGLPALAGDF
jgi:hypothetical protein